MATYNEQKITDLMRKFARREAMTEEEITILEDWAEHSPENRELMEQFGDLEWVKAELAKLHSAPMNLIWARINKHLDKIGAPDDRPLVDRILTPIKGKLSWIIWRLRR